MKKYIFVAIATLGLGAISHEAKTLSYKDMTSQLREDLPSFERKMQEIEMFLDTCEENLVSFPKDQQAKINIALKKYKELFVCITKLKQTLEHNHATSNIQNKKTEKLCSEMKNLLLELDESLSEVTIIIRDLHL